MAVTDLILDGDKMLFMNHYGEVEELDCTTNNSNKVIMNNSTFVSNMYMHCTE